MELLKKGFTYPRGLELYRKGIRCVEDVWDSNKKNFYSWEEAQGKFNLMPTDARDWGGIINKLAEDWRGSLKRIRIPPTPGCGLGYMRKVKKTPLS
jgi:hypothetical protein